MWWNVLANPEIRDAVLDDISLWDNAFTETMRRTPAVISEDRFVANRLNYTREIHEGERIRACQTHLDPTVFTDPLTFDLFRSDLHIGKEKPYRCIKRPIAKWSFRFWIRQTLLYWLRTSSKRSCHGFEMLVEKLGNPHWVKARLDL